MQEDSPAAAAAPQTTASPAAVLGRHSTSMPRGQEPTDPLVAQQSTDRRDRANEPAASQSANSDVRQNDDSALAKSDQTPHSSPGAAEGTAKQTGATCGSAASLIAGPGIAALTAVPAQLAGTPSAGILLTGVHIQSSGLQGAMAVSQSVHLLTTALPAQPQQSGMPASGPMPSPMRAGVLSAPPASRPGTSAG